MSLAHLNQESRNELERRVLAAALKLSLLRGDKMGAKLAHQCLATLLKAEKDGQLEGQDEEPTNGSNELSPEDAVPVSDDLAERNPALADESAVTITESLSAALNTENETTQATDNVTEATKTLQQLQSIGERLAKPALNIDFELPPAEKEKLKAASTKASKAVKPTQNATPPSPVELTATAENPTIYGSEGEQMIAGIILPPFLTEPQIGLQYHALYKMLGVRQTASRDDIHKTFLRLVRRILRELKGAKRPSRQELLGYLRKLWIAHDILTDPNTRTDYDFRDLGLRGLPESEPPSPEPVNKALPTQMLLRIGELLQAAGLLETAELEIACDMHKAMPEMMFGTFLVKQGFIQDSELDSVLFGQKALRAGAISVAQFSEAMELSREKSITVKEALIEMGFATRAKLDELDQKQEVQPPPADTTNGAPNEEKASEAVVMPSASSVIEERLASAQPLQISKAVPKWKDQLDWGSPEESVQIEENKQVEPQSINVTDVTEVTEAVEVVERVASEQNETIEPVPTQENAEAITPNTPPEISIEPELQEAHPPVESLPPSRREAIPIDQGPGLFSHMREAASFYDAEEDFFATYNYAQSEENVSTNEPSITYDEVKNSEPEQFDEQPTADENMGSSDDLGQSDSLQIETEEESESNAEIETGEAIPIEHLGALDVEPTVVVEQNADESPQEALDEVPAEVNSSQESVEPVDSDLVEAVTVSATETKNATETEIVIIDNEPVLEETTNEEEIKEEEEEIEESTDDKNSERGENSDTTFAEESKEETSTPD